MTVRKNRYGQFHYGESYYYAPIPVSAGERSVLITSNPLLIFEVPPVFVGGGNINIQSLLSTIRFYIPLFVSKDNIMGTLGLKVLRDSRHDVIMPWQCEIEVGEPEERLSSQLASNIAWTEHFVETVKSKKNVKSFDVITDIDFGANKIKTRTLTLTGGIVTGVSDKSNWK